VSHTVRCFDFSSSSLTTVAGTGAAAMSGEDLAAGGLRSPWDACWIEPYLYVAMAGTHQLWRMEPFAAGSRLEPYVGSGREGLQDGPLRAAWLAQPSGLASDGRDLFVADSEVSAVRRVDLAAGAVTTLVGEGLFEFGDADGVGSAVRLQHPLGVACDGGLVYVADTYNNKLKRLEPASRRVTTVVGSGLNEPSGVCVLGDRAYVADTNDHRVRVVQLPGGEMSDLEIVGL
jgi:DNA-binding beta-propeller fold protein YncE